MKPFILLATLPLFPGFASAALQRTSESNEALRIPEVAAPSDPGNCDEGLQIVPDVPIVGESFGQALAADGDTLVVGAPGGTPGGFVYVFRRQGSTWVQEARLFPPTRSREDRFGGSVAIEGDTLAVGSGNANLSGVGLKAGRAYVFERTGTSWALQRSFRRPTGAAAGDLFGWSVSLSAEILVVGAPGASGLFPNEGLAFVYTRTGTDWRLEQELSVSTVIGQSPKFGSAVAIDGNVLLVGQPGRSRAHFFHRAGTSWVPRTRVGASSSGFGRAVALDGGMALVSDASFNRVLVYGRSGQDWTRQPDLPTPPLDSNERYGRSLSLSERALVVGSVRWDPFENQEVGCAYVYPKSGSTWKRPKRIVADNPTAGSRFGNAIDQVGDSVFVGAPNMPGVGTAYEFDLETACGGIQGGEEESLIAANPRLGERWTVRVHPRRTGHSHALILGHSSSGRRELPGGRSLLLSGQPLFRSPLLGTGVWSVMIPADRSLLGRTMHVQAVHLLGGASYALTNAVELRVER